jgi:hypothetical protein
VSKILVLEITDMSLQKLYHSTLAIRPKLIELIGKYSQRKGIALIPRHVILYINSP